MPLAAACREQRASAARDPLSRTITARPAPLLQPAARPLPCAQGSRPQRHYSTTLLVSRERITGLNQRRTLLSWLLDTCPPTALRRATANTSCLSIALSLKQQADIFIASFWKVGHNIRLRHTSLNRGACKWGASVSQQHKSANPQRPTYSRVGLRSMVRFHSSF